LDPKPAFLVGVPPLVAGAAITIEPTVLLTVVIQPAT